MKKAIFLVLVLVIIFSAYPAAYATDETTPADDPVIEELVISGSLNFSGTTAYCSGSVTEPGKYIHATMTLSHGSTVVGSWMAGGSSIVNLSGSCAVTKGESYTLVISGTVDGVPFSSTPYTKTC